MRWDKASALAAPAVLVCCIAAYFALFLPPSLASGGRDQLATSYDLQSYFLPRFAYGSQELAAGRFPLWNPYEDAGVPFFATAQPAVLYPPKLILFGLLSPVRAYWAFLVVHYLALAGGFFLFMREERIRGTAALAGAAVWTFAVPVMMSNYHPTRIANLVFVPLVFVLVERIARGAGRRAIALLGLLVALQLLAGYPECAVDVGLLVALHASVRFAMKEWPAPPWRTVPIFALAFALGALLAGVQLVPLLEAALAAGRTAVASAARESQPIMPERLAAPGLVSVPGLVVFSWLALFSRRGRSAAIALVTCVVLGRWGWVWLQRLPGLSMLRFPYVWLEVSPFYVGWLTALGCEGFLERRTPSRLRPMAERVGAGLVIVVSLAWAGYAALEWHRLRVGGPSLGWVWARLARNVGSETAAALGIAGALALAASAFGAPRAGSARVGREALAAVAVTLLVISHEASYPFGGSPAPFARPEPKGEIQGYVGDEITMTGRALSLRDIQYGYPLSDRMASPLGAEESFVPYRFRRVIERFELWPMLGHLDWVGFVSAAGFLDALDVQLIAAPLDVAPYLGGTDLVPIRRGNESLLFQNPNAMGRAWVDYGVQVAESPDAAFRYVLGPRFDPHSEVILEGPPEGTYPTRTDLPPTWPTAERRTSANDVEYDVQLPRAGVLVQSESIYPGWQVTVDGRGAKILPADYVLRGVELPPGHHTVRFEYRPWSLRVGALVSAAALLVLVGLCFRRRSPATPAPFLEGAP